MKKIYLILLFTFICSIAKAQSPCLVSLDSVYLDTAQSTCNQLYFKYNVTGGTISSYGWTYGDGNACACIKPKNFYTKNGTYEVCGIIKDVNACPDTLCASFNVNCSNPCDLSGIGIFSADTLSYSCNEIEFNSIISDNAKKIRWDFGDGDSSDQTYVIHTFNQNGQYNVRLIIQDSIACADTADFTIQIDCSITTPCDFRLTSIDTASGVGCKTKLFQLKSNVNPKLIRWEFGDGQFVLNTKSTQITYQDTGLYEVCVYASDSMDCKDTICQWVLVKCPKPSTSVYGLTTNSNYLYPNPFTDVLIIQMLDIAECIIYDVNMKIIKTVKLEQGNNELNLSDLKSGVYFFKLQTDTNSSVYSLIKE